MSALATQTLPGLFFGNAAWVEVLRDVRSEPDAVVGGEPCFVLAGSFQNTRTRLWISQRDLWLRQWEQVNTDRPGDGAQTAATPVAGRVFRTLQQFERVRFNEALGKDDFRFSPPATPP